MTVRRKILLEDLDLNSIANPNSHASRHSSGGADALSGLTYDQLATNTIQFEIAIPLLTDSISGTGTVEAAERYLISSELLNHAKAAYFEIAYDASSLTSDGSADLYDVTGASVITSITLTAGGSSERTRSSDILSSLVAGNEVKVRVTGDGTNAATLRMARLIIVIGIS